MSPRNDLLHKAFGRIDGLVELYLGSIIKPFLAYHELFYAAINKASRSAMDANKPKIADWFTANFITYLRTIFVIPTLLLMASGHTLLPSLIVIAVDFGDFLDGVVARFWVDVKKEREEALTSKSKTSSSPTNSDDESFGTLLLDCRRSAARKFIAASTHQI
jgi:hypothetical protein